jgi:hypothetical protein
MLPAATVPSTAYPAAVAADNPVLWYELNETSGTVAYDSSASPHNGVYQGGVTFGASGAVTDGVTLDGSSAYISNANVVTSPTSFSLGIWFRTTTKSGGLIIGFGNSATGASTNYDRQIYMGNLGQVYFGVASNQTIHSNAQYNDGLWHEAIATIGSAGMFLYIDGVLVASSTLTSASAQTYSGSWRVGYNSLGGWSARPSSNYFAGSVSQASVYHYQLTAAQVVAHHAAAAQPPAPLADTAPPAETAPPAAVAPADEAASTAAAPALGFPVPPGEAGVGYRHELEVAGGTAPHHWEVSDGQLPDGITLDPDTGALTGTPASAGGYHFTVRVTDAAGQSVTRPTSLTIVAAPAIDVASLPGGEAGADYRHDLTVTGGTAPYHWEVSDGLLPDGITLDPDTGTVAGTPTVPGPAHFTLQVTDAAGQADAAATSLAVTAPALGFPAPAGQAGTAYRYELAITGGTAPYHWEVSDGLLPDGITLDPDTGTVAGTPTAPGPAHFTLQVTDAAGQSAAQAVSLAIGSPGPG